MRDRDLSTTHSHHEPAGRPLEAARPSRRWARWRCTRSARPTTGIIVRGARMLATLAPFADELTVYPAAPTSARRTAATPWLRDPDGHAGPQVHLPRLVRQAARPASTTRSPSRFDEMDARGDLRRRRGAPGARVPGRRHRGLLRGHHRHGLARATSCTRPSRAPTSKLSFAFGLGHLIANTTGVVRFDHVQEKLGQIWNMVELTRVGAGRRRGRLARGRPSASGTPTSGPSWHCAARCRSGSRT